ncbi:MAG: AsmA family protein, partial [Kiloniellales bacterium]
PYLPPEAEAESGGGQSAEPGSGGGGAESDWSDEPIDLAALKLADADLAFSAGAIKVRKIAIGKSVLTVKLNEGLLTADLSEMALYEGGGKGKVTLDGSKATPAVQANFDLADVQAQPLLRDAADMEKLLGTMNGKIAVTAQGKSQRELVSSLDGDGAITVLDGAIKGINIAAMLRSISVSALREGFSDSEQTDFAELSGTFQIADGIATNNDLKMDAPLLRLTGKGTVNLPERTIDYRLEPKAVASIEGQGGAEDLAGIMIPFRVAGPWSSPSFTPDIGGALKEQIKDPSKLKEKLKDLIPGQSAPEQGGEAAPSENQEPATPQPEQLLKGFFGNGGG